MTPVPQLSSKQARRRLKQLSFCLGSGRDAVSPDMISILYRPISGDITSSRYKGGGINIHMHVPVPWPFHAPGSVAGNGLHGLAAHTMQSISLISMAARPMPFGQT